jgi:predicted nucleic acid-binding protein
MTAVVDTNVIAYLLLGTPPFITEVRHFWQAVDETFAPAVWEAELANVMWMAIRNGVLIPEDGPQRLRLAARLGIQSAPCRSLWEGALVRAISFQLSPYDSLFVELAARRRIPLATFDSKILSKFPAVAARPASLLGA